MRSIALTIERSGVEQDVRRPAALLDHRRADDHGDGDAGEGVGDAKGRKGPRSLGRSAPQPRPRHHLESAQRAAADGGRRAEARPCSKCGSSPAPVALALWLPDPRALVFADALTAPEGELRIWSTPWHRERVVPALRQLLKLPFEHVIVSHGEPVHEPMSVLLSSTLGTDNWWLSQRYGWLFGSAGQRIIR
jgi:hypothetical protein